MALAKQTSRSPSAMSGRGISAKEFFFDRATVVHAMDNAKRRNLAIAGAIIRRSAIKSIREQDPSRPSRPGEPPRSVNGLIERFLFYSWDPATESMVVGPEIFPTTRAPGGIPIPSLLEHGGIGQHKSGKNYLMEPRPYMQPALERHIDKIAPVWRGSVTTA